MEEGLGIGREKHTSTLYFLVKYFYAVQMMRISMEEVYNATASWVL